MIVLTLIQTHEPSTCEFGEAKPHAANIATQGMIILTFRRFHVLTFWH